MELKPLQTRIYIYILSEYLKNQCYRSIYFDADPDPGSALERMDPDQLKFTEFLTKTNFQSINSVKSNNLSLKS